MVWTIYLSQKTEFRTLLIFDGKVLTVVIFFLALIVILPIHGELQSPREQVKQGVLAEDILCNKGLELIVRTNGSPACVKSQTAERMQKAGIGFAPIKVTDLNKVNNTLQAAEKTQKVGIGFTPIKVTDLNKVNNTLQAAENEIQAVPASSMSVVNFYIMDHDLNIAHGGVEVVPTEGLFEFTVNGIPIKGPKNMIETGPNTGQFFIKLELPQTVNGKPLSQDDIVLIKYLDESDHSGQQRTLVKSVPLVKTFAQVQTSGGGSRIGHEFTVRVYEPDANRDSKDEDKIPLSELEFRGERGIRTTLSNPEFDANSAYLVETGPNSNTFEVKIKIPRQLDGKTVHIGDEYEIRYVDRTTPSNTNEKIILKGKIG